MNRKLLLIAIMVCLMILAAGCTKKEPQTATLSLDSNPTTGYSWTATQDPELFEITSEYVEDEKKLRKA